MHKIVPLLILICFDIFVYLISEELYYWSFTIFYFILNKFLFGPIKPIKYHFIIIRQTLQVYSYSLPSSSILSNLHLSTLILITYLFSFLFEAPHHSITHSPPQLCIFISALSLDSKSRGLYPRQLIRLMLVKIAAML